jgi:methylmalonyl-CoA/ethylmalonyl-CoA epimerase
MSETRFELRQIRQIAIPVKDIDRAIAFYRDVLGMSFLFRAPPGLGFFDCGGVRLMLSVPEKAEDANPGSLLYYGVDDMAAAKSALNAAGVTFESEPHVVHRAADHDLWMGAFRDSEGNLMALMREEPKP